MHTRRFRQLGRGPRQQGPLSILRYALEYREDQTETHNELVQTIDDAEETVQKRDATIARQSAALLCILDENEEDRVYHQAFPTSHEFKKSTKLREPPLPSRAKV